jgi:hypothetical protein
VQRRERLEGHGAGTEPWILLCLAEIGPLIADVDAASIICCIRFIAAGVNEMTNLIESRLPFEPCDYQCRRTLFPDSLQGPDTQGIPVWPHLVFTLTLARCDFGQHMHTQLAESTVLAAYAYHAASGLFKTEIAKSPRTQHH